MTYHIGCMERSSVISNFSLFCGIVIRFRTITHFPMYCVLVVLHFVFFFENFVTLITVQQQNSFLHYLSTMRTSYSWRSHQLLKYSTWMWHGQLHSDFLCKNIFYSVLFLLVSIYKNQCIILSLWCFLECSFSLSTVRWTFLSDLLSQESHLNLFSGCSVRKWVIISVFPSKSLSHLSHLILVAECSDK